MSISQEWDKYRSSMSGEVSSQGGTMADFLELAWKGEVNDRELRDAAFRHGVRGHEEGTTSRYVIAPVDMDIARHLVAERRQHARWGADPDVEDVAVSPAEPFAAQSCHVEVEGEATWIVYEAQLAPVEPAGPRTQFESRTLKVNRHDLNRISVLEIENGTTHLLSQWSGVQALSRAVDPPLI